ncbi:hypothetical protein, partial [Deinococcus pimensis]|uniref:hypothetical protein n=1 Tax=Deinococcus pimensis TaxID=309888 RepID=UPI0005EB4367
MLNFRDVRDAVLAGSREHPNFPFGVPFDLTVFDPRAPGVFQDALRALREQARRAALTPPPPLPFSDFRRFSVDGTRREHERAYFERRARLLPLTVTALQGDEAALAGLEDLLW